VAHILCICGVLKKKEYSRRFEKVAFFFSENKVPKGQKTTPLPTSEKEKQAG